MVAVAGVAADSLVVIVRVEVNTVKVAAAVQLDTRLFETKIFALLQLNTP
jgi:hypothetical protein